MTVRPFEQQIPRRLHAKHGVFCSRVFSIILAVIADARLVFLLSQHKWTSATDDIELFWVRQFIAFAIYSALQIWTLAFQTGRGDEFAATIDKVFAASPAIVTALIQMYWIGHHSGATVLKATRGFPGFGAFSRSQIISPPISLISVCG